EHERDDVGDEQRQRHQPRPHERLKALADLAVELGPAQLHAVTLRGGVGGGQAARYELRLAGRLERAGPVDAEGGADLVARQGAEPRAAEVAVIARCPVFLAHSRMW